MNTVSICEKCGTKLDRNSELPCPGCLMQLGMAQWGTPSQSLRNDMSDLPPTLPPRKEPTNAAPKETGYRIAEAVEAHFPGLEIVDLLGEGGMGMVFKARQTSLERDVAVKVIKADNQHREAFENRFAREAKALASLNHPNIVTVHDFGKSDDFFFLMMEFVDGINLRELLAGKKITPREALEIIPQICDALQYAHDRGVVHRDIKPENILVDRNGRVKIADYGLAKLVNEESSAPSLTRTHHVMGTPHYMAPEQVEKPMSVDHRADIYSLGVVIYEMLTGELPLGRFDLPSQKAEIDSRLDEIVIQSLEKEPGRRYQKVSDVKTDFESVMEPAESLTPKHSQSVPPSANRMFPDQAVHRKQNVNQQIRNDQIDPRNEPAPVANSPAYNSPVANGLQGRRVGPQKPIVNQADPYQPGKGDFGKEKSNRNPYEQGRGKPPVMTGPFSFQTYMKAAYLMASFPIGLICFVLALVTICAGVPLTIIWIGFFILFAGFHALQAMFAIDRTLCKWLLGEEIPYRSPVLDHSTKFGKFTAILTSGSTWWGVLYSILRFPWSVVCFVLVLVFFTLPLMFLAAPLLFTQWWFEIEIGSFEIDSIERALLAALLGLPLFYLGVQLTNGLAFVTRKMNRFFLARY